MLLTERLKINCPFLQVLESVLSVNDGTTMASLLEINVVLWKSIHKALNENKEAKNYTIMKFASVLPIYFKTFTVKTFLVNISNPSLNFD